MADRPENQGVAKTDRDDARYNPPPGYTFDCVVTPVIHRGICTWYDGVGDEVDTVGPALIPRPADRDGTCYCFRPIAVVAVDMERLERTAREIESVIGGNHWDLNRRLAVWHLRNGGLTNGERRECDTCAHFLTVVEDNAKHCGNGCCDR